MTDIVRQTITAATPNPDINYKILVNNLSQWFDMLNVPDHTKEDEDNLASRVYPMIHSSIANLMKKHGPDVMEAILCSIDSQLDRSEFSEACCHACYMEKPERVLDPNYDEEGASEFV